MDIKKQTSPGGKSHLLSLTEHPEKCEEIIIQYRASKIKACDWNVPERGLPNIHSGTNRNNESDKNLTIIAPQKVKLLNI